MLKFAMGKEETIGGWCPRETTVCSAGISWITAVLKAQGYGAEEARKSYRQRPAVNGDALMKMRARHIQL